MLIYSTADFSGLMDFEVVAIATNLTSPYHEVIAETMEEFTVNIVGVADAPALSVPEWDVEATEDSFIVIDWSQAELRDTDGSETLTLELRTNDTNVYEVPRSNSKVKSN